MSEYKSYVFVETIPGIYKQLDFLLTTAVRFFNITNIPPGLLTSTFAISSLLDKISHI